MKNILFALVLGILGAPAVHAACTAPSGRYVGSGGGLDIDATGKIVGGTVTQISVRLSAVGIWKGKWWSTDQNGHNAQAFTVPAIGTPGNSFDTKTCHGLFTIVGGDTFSYVVSDRGKIIKIMLWIPAAGNLFWNGIVKLKKV